ncbi:MAG: acyl carrier protein [Burkholderiaceae bacterium]
MSATLEHLQQMVIEHLDVAPEQISAEQPFAELGLDSLSLVDFMFAVEDHYHISIDHERAMAEPTLVGLARLVDELCAAKAPAALAA